MRFSAFKIFTGIGAAMVVGALGLSPALAGEHGHSGSAAFDEGMAPILASYLAIQQALAADSTSGVRAAAKAITGSAGKLDAASVEGEHAAHYKHLPMKIEKAATALGKASTIEVARAAFKQLSMPMAMWGTMSKPAGVDVVFCSMAKGSWLQKAGTVMNPYYGKSMLHCGEVVGGAGHTAKAGGHGGH